MKIKILKIEIFKLNVEIAIPIKILLGNSDGADNLAIKVTTDNGIVGWGESSPCAEITGDSQDTNYVTAQKMARLIKGKNALSLGFLNPDDSRFHEGEQTVLGVDFYIKKDFKFKCKFNSTYISMYFF